MRTLDWSSLDEAGRRDALARPARRTDDAVTGAVRRILDDIRDRGDAALNDWCVKLDGAPPRRLAITPEAVAEARAAVEPGDEAALRIAAENIRRFHEATKPADSDWIETTPGVRSRRVWRPIQAAGLYVPAGTAPLFSTLLMLAIPAAVAGVPVRAAVTPPGPTGQPHPMMILAADLAGLDALWIVGGAQGIAALTFGTGGLPRVDKLFGPGNAYVAEAKKQAAALPGGPALDMPAGPSELMVIADRQTNPTIAAADLLSQAEHDADAQVILVCDDDRRIAYILEEIEKQLADLPRADIARASLNEGRVIRVRDTAEAAAVANLYGPEHLSIQTADAEVLVDRITAAGAVFVGTYAAETLGDYAAGPSHVLPTDGAARAFSGVSTSAFMTAMSVQQISRDGARALGPVAARLARLEGLEAHARAADLRTFL
ncbi:MAG: histidinol dehydrogenase [Brevundimonas sp.]